MAQYHEGFDLINDIEEIVANCLIKVTLVKITKLSKFVSSWHDEPSANLVKLFQQNINDFAIVGLKANK